jgi:xylulokinase
MSTYWLGLDIGTGGSRALLIDGSGRVAFAHTAPHEDMIMAQPLWAEQRPENWWDAAQQAIRGVLAQAGVTGEAVRGVGLSGQMHGLTLLDETNQVIRPALIWCDQRSQPQVDAATAQAGAEFILAQTANPMLTGFTLPKLLWVRDHEPAAYARVRHLLLPKDYVRFGLTGEHVSDVSDASGTGLFDVVNRRWAFDLADRLGVDRAILPRVVESSDVSGVVSAPAAAATGLRAGTPVVGGAGDQAASAAGNGIVTPGLVSCTIGTSGVVFAHQTAPAYDPRGRVHTFCHSVTAAWHVMGVTQGAGLSLQWLRHQLMPGAEYDAMTAEAAHAPAGAQGLFWLPYLMGERTPHLDAQARGGWMGLTAKHTRADLIRAVLEGVAYSQKDGLEIIEGMGVAVRSVRLSGGGAKSSFWRQIFADVFAKPVEILESQEGSAYGAGLLAMVGTGHFASLAEAAANVIRTETVVEPGHAVAEYAAGHRVYQALYPALRNALLR